MLTEMDNLPPLLGVTTPLGEPTSEKQNFMSARELIEIEPLTINVDIETPISVTPGGVRLREMLVGSLAPPGII